MDEKKKKKPANQHRITPIEVLTEIRKFMPEIALDPCWNPYALTDPIFSCDGVTSSGLEVDWCAIVEEAGIGGIFVNPPWNSPKEWVEKMVAEAARCHFKHDMLLWLPFYPETATGEQIWEHGKRICAWGRRVNHPEPPIDENGNLLINGDLGSSSGSMWPTWLTYFGRRTEEFEHVFRPNGPVIWGWNCKSDSIERPALELVG